MGKVFKICEEDEWEGAKNKEFFAGSNSDLRDGFIHFSTSEQLKETLEKHFKLKSPLYLLAVETDDLEIEWEISRDNQFFPHLYEPLPLSTVKNVYKIILDAEETHIIPEAVYDD